MVEFAQEHDAETEPGALGRDALQPESRGFGSSAALVSAGSMNERAASHRDPPLYEEGNVVATGVSRHSYPPEYDPFDRPVEEVVTQLFDDVQPVNPPPAKRRR